MDRPNLSALLPALSRGDEDSIRALVDEALARLAAIARGCGASPEDAEEIGLDSIVETLARLDSVEFDRIRAADPLFSYMAKTAQNKAFERHRRTRAENRALAAAVNAPRGSQLLSESDHDRGSLLWHESTATTSDSSFASDMLDSLSEKDRQIVEFRVHTNLTWEEIAEEASIKPAAARKQWQRIVERFRAKEKPGVSRNG